MTNHTKHSQLVCTMCGSDELEVTLVVDPNTMNVLRWTDLGGMPDVQCLDCNHPGAQITTKLAFDRKQLLKTRAEFAEEQDQRLRGDL